MTSTKFSVIAIGMTVIGMAIMFVANVLAISIGLPNDIAMGMGKFGGLGVLVGGAMYTGYLFGQQTKKY